MPVKFRGIAQCLLTTGLLLAAAARAAAQESLTFDAPQCAGMSGLRAHWDQPITVTENGKRLLRDTVVKDRGQSAVWGTGETGPLAFDAAHRSLLVRFPGAAERIAEAINAGKAIDRIELVLPYLDEEIWPMSTAGTDFPSADGYRYRTNWGTDKLYREQRPNWHAVAHVLRKPWAADATTGPTFNAAVNGAVYWKRFGASDTTEDRFAPELGPTEVSSYKPEGRMDVTSVVTDPAYGANIGARLRTLADCGFVIKKLEVYDARYFTGAYEWSISTGPRAILVRQPKLVVTLKTGGAEKITLPAATDVAALAAAHKSRPVGAPTAVVPSPAEVKALDAKFMAKPAWMPDWQYAHVKQLMTLESDGKLHPFYYRMYPEYVVQHERQRQEQLAKQRKQPLDPDQLDYAVYLNWLDWVNGCPPRYWEGHLTAANNVTQWYNCREAIPAPVQDAILRSWTAWLMPNRETETGEARRLLDNTSGKLVHPMVDDPRVGKDKSGKTAEWGRGDTYYKLTGDWRGNKSYYRSGFTREISTANFNSSASSGALLNGQIIGSKNAIEDGRAGLMKFPFWMWTHSAGVGQEFIDHYYWAIATAGNKNFPDFCEAPEDRMAGWSIITKTVNDLAGAYHPGLKKLLGPASRTYYEHVLGTQDGMYHILHVISPKGALCDIGTKKLDAIGAPTWGHDYPPEMVALQSMSGPWADPWFAELVDEKPLPWSALLEKKVVANGDWVSTYFGENYGLSSIRLTPQRIHVLGQWRRKAAVPSSMREIGTIDLRVGFNQTTIGNDLEGGISAQGVYRTYQSNNRLIMLARPQSNIIQQQAGEHPFGQKKLPAQPITSVQCTAALFNFEQPNPTWAIYIDDQKVESLPATAKQGQVITVHDGVSYLALRPLPTDNLGREADITLETANPQTQAYHESTIIKPALFVHANFYRKAEPISGDAMKKLGSANSGFVVEMGDEKEYGSFAEFRARAIKAKVSVDGGTVRYETGKDALAASWDAFTVNGSDPYAQAKERKLLQDTSLTQMGQTRLEKNGAILDRGPEHPELNTFLITLPKQKIYVAMNLLPNYLSYSFKEPGGVQIVADGACSMGRWMVKDSREIDIKYHPFTAPYLPNDGSVQVATMLFISGTKGTPSVKLNDKNMSGSLKPWKQDGRDGWLVPLTADSPIPANDQITARFAAAARKLAEKPATGGN